MGTRFRQAVLAMVVLAASSLLAQEYRARVQGFVTDPSRAAIVGATVTLRNPGTGIDMVRKTGENGWYLFDLVQPGTYAVMVEAPGFKKFLRADIPVQTRADVTVNAALEIGAITESVQVTVAASAVEFNTGTMSQTVTGGMLSNLPTIARSPFTLAILNPGAVDRYSATGVTDFPFYQVSHSGMSIGGPTAGKNQLLLDGVDTRVAQRGSYAPPMDAVQEFVVQQNPVDAEYGNSAGSAISVAMKSGTNDVHGSLYYYGRNPTLAAVTNAFTRTPNVSRNHIFGGALGGPVYIPKVYSGKNRAFWFFTYERWKAKQVGSQANSTMPTDLQRTGDFSQTLNRYGNLAAIYDPLTTRQDPTTKQWIRAPFAGNKIPSGRIDASAAALMQYFYKPRSAGLGPAGANNWQVVPMIGNPYANLSARGDYLFSENWRMFGRYSRHRQQQQPEPIETSPAYASGSAANMYALNVAANVDGTLSSTLFVNFRFGYVRSADELLCPLGLLDNSFYSKIWPNSNWYQLANSSLKKIYFPYTLMRDGSASTATFGLSSGWDLLPRQATYSGTVMKQAARHYLKFGVKLTHASSNNALPSPGNMIFNTTTTASTHVTPVPTDVSGNAYASFLLGYIDSGVTTYTSRIWTISNNLGLFIQDDWKLGRDWTLNVGLRWEYDQAPTEHDLHLARFLDLSDPIPEFKVTPPPMPDLSQYGVTSYRFNGAYYFLDSKNPRLFRTPKDVLLPRIGLAYRVNDKTSIRFGWGRFAIPFEATGGPNWYLPNPGFSQSTSVIGPIQGVPQAMLSNPFPSTNPVQQPLGASLGRYSQLGNNIVFFRQDPVQPVNDRFNLSLQRELPGQIRLDTTFFMNVGRNTPTADNYWQLWGNGWANEQENLMNPALSYQYKSAIDAAVANPFYRYLTASVFPGALRNQPTIALNRLLTPYPQYGTIQQNYMTGQKNRYRAVQLQAEKALAHGLNFSLGYSYSRGWASQYFNADAQYARQYSIMSDRNFRHSLSIAPYWEFPFGRGRKYGHRLHPVAEAILGGWTTSHVFRWRSGYYLSWPSMGTSGVANQNALQVSGNPVLSNRTLARWFNTDAFARATPYTPRTNPWWFQGLTGPRWWNLDSTVAKNFQLAEKLRLEFRLEAFNTTNTFIPGMPNVTQTSALFGSITSQLNVGRQVEYAMRLHF